MEQESITFRLTNGRSGWCSRITHYFHISQSLKTWRLGFDFGKSIKTTLRRKSSTSLIWSDWSASKIAFQGNSVGGNSSGSPSHERLSLSQVFYCWMNH